MTSLLTTIACVIIFTLVVAAYRAYMDRFEPQCVCPDCGWEGNEFELQVIATPQEEPFIFLCPTCKGDGIVFTDEKIA